MYKRQFLYVIDIAKALIALLESECHGIVNIASGVPVTVKEVIQTIAEIIGKPELVLFGAIPTPKNEPPLIYADITRLSNEVGFKHSTNLRTGITETINWWKSKLKEVT